MRGGAHDCRVHAQQTGQIQAHYLAAEIASLTTELYPDEADGRA